MSGTIFVGLLQNAGLLLALAFLYDALPAQPKPGRRGLEILEGVLIGSIALVVMLNPVRFSPGVIFDTRSVLLSVTGLFFGGVPAGIAAVMAAALRLYQGGAGAWTGIGVIVVSTGLGVLWRRARGRWFLSFHVVELYAFGVVVHVAMLLMMFTLPLDAALGVLRDISAPVLIVYPVGTVLLGLLMARQRAQRQERNLLKMVIETSPVGIVRMDRAGVFTFANAHAQRVLGLSRDQIAGRVYNSPEWLVTDFDGGSIPDDESPFRLVMESGRAVSDVRLAVEWPNGRRVLLSINAAPLLDGAGHIDVIMPGMNGVELRDQIVARRPDIKTLFMSGYSEDVIAHGGVIETGIHFIEKPFSISGLAEKVRGILDA